VGQSLLGTPALYYFGTTKSERTSEFGSSVATS
jgi:hypothetical protein